MVDVMAEMRERASDGETVESIRRDMIVRNYPTDEVERAAKALDWISEKRNLEDSGKMDLYEVVHESESKQVMWKRAFIIVFGIIAIIGWFMLFGDVLGVFGSIFILVIMGVLYGAVQNKGSY